MEPRPVPAVIAVVHRGDAVLLVRRGCPPNAGAWGFPGGKIELGEGLRAAAERECLEETGVRCAAVRVLDCLDAISEGGWHYVLVAVLCDWREGDPVAGDDAAEARWVPLAALDDWPGLIAEVARIARMPRA
ncbi:NUDIX hydrolase [Amaricoccus solimangrovi]|uniref:NUDIX domain-containing protein n=1 Tax=Amaricoccus solimangrovi TaxID=2589815 RepID=A0A501X0C5_9RHOB|nr:NUDIX hydrolase [Amaricoccus solimangrovi]TPE53041.1 NUDIX domain-containing protein [Amaricoccus solimangrovi]